MPRRIGSHLLGRELNGSEERNASPIRDLGWYADSQNALT